MPTGLRSGTRRWPVGQKELIRAMTKRRYELGMSCREVAEASGFYGRAMLACLENAVKPGATRKPRMSYRGMNSIRAWLKSTARRVRKAA